MAAADYALSVLLSTPSLTLSALLIYGSVSRAFGGRYTGRAFYRYQVDRLPDDQSPIARLTPVVDAMLAFSLLWPGLPRRIASALVFLLFLLGFLRRVQVGKEATVDALLTGYALINTVMVFIFPVWGHTGLNAVPQ